MFSVGYKAIAVDSHHKLLRIGWRNGLAVASATPPGSIFGDNNSINCYSGESSSLIIEKALAFW
jgi:hypothetical protein